jgi:hypothetical protein
MESPVDTPLLLLRIVVGLYSPLTAQTLTNLAIAVSPAIAGLGAYSLDAPLGFTVQPQPEAH